MKYVRRKTPTVIQVEAVECGAASLAIILEYFGRYVPLAQLRLDCGVSRDGSNALNMLRAAAKYGLEGKGYRKSVEELFELEPPFVIMWEANHFLVVEGFSKDKVYLNDPAVGPRSVSHEEFKEGFFEIAIIFTRTEEFQKGGMPEPLTVAIYKRLKQVKLPLLYLFLAGMCLLLPGLALPAFIRVFVDHVLVSYSVGPASLLLSGILIVATIGGALIYLQNYFLSRLKSRLAIQFTSQFLWHLLRLPVSFYTQRFSGEIAFRTVINDRIAGQLAGTLATTCIDLILIIFYGIVMLRYDLMLGSIGFIAAIVNMVLFSWIQRSRKDAYARLQQEMGKWLGNAIGALQQMETIKALGIESDFFARFSGYYAKNINADQEISKKDAILGSVPLAAQAFSMAILLIAGSIKVMQGELTFGMLISLQTLLIAFLGPIGRFVNFGEAMQFLRIDMGRIDDVLTNTIDPIYTVPRQKTDSSKIKLEGYLEFRNVTFGYSRLAPPLLNNFSFIIKPGQRLALVGPSGCGKSTIAKLAAGLFSPWEGEILYDGMPLKDIASDVFYHSFGHVDQDIFLFSGTIRSNITLWNLNVAEEMIIQAAEDACIHEEIILRPLGYDNILAERGRNLSGGQRQRLEIARSLLYSPSILVMDEATSALDSETERTISERIRRKGCSTIMIAHRLSTIQDYDEIIVLEKGEVVQRGTHEELKGQSGLYRDLIGSA
jgi:NHLM bacteriocin system ABC transporter peptidase/ATP-binding protein